jgi:hypothetical protein
MPLILLWLLGVPLGSSLSCSCWVLVASTVSLGHIVKARPEATKRSGKTNAPVRQPAPKP